MSNYRKNTLARNCPQQETNANPGVEKATPSGHALRRTTGNERSSDRVLQEPRESQETALLAAIRTWITEFPGDAWENWDTDSSSGDSFEDDGDPSISDDAGSGNG